MTEKELKTLGRNLRILIGDKETTRRKLADEIGVHEAFISQVVRGKKVPSLNVLIGIAKALNVSVDELLDGVYEKGG